MKTYCKKIVNDIENCNLDHISDYDVQEAKNELMELLDCDAYSLGEFLKFFVEVNVITDISIK